MTLRDLSNIRRSAELAKGAREEQDRLNDEAQPWSRTYREAQRTMYEAAIELLLAGVDIEDIIEATGAFGHPPYGPGERDAFAAQCGWAVQEIVRGA